MTGTTISRARKSIRKPLPTRPRLAQASRSREARSIDAKSRRILASMLAFRDGTFSVRLPPDWEGVEGQFAAAFNQAVSNADRLTREASRLSRAIGREGRLKEPLSLPGAAGCWADKVDYFNRILDDLARPRTETSQSHGAVPI